MRSNREEDVIEIGLEDELRGCHDRWKGELSLLMYKLSRKTENILSLEKEIEWTRERTKKMRSLNVLDDTFFVWHSGRSATINGFRVSRIVNETRLNWHEVNSALGQLLMLLSNTPNFQGQSTELLPLGSSSRIAKASDRTHYGQFPLFTDDSFSLLPKRSFNTALSLLLRHIQEWHTKMSALDPSIQFPYAIESNGTKIAGLSIAYGSNDTAWTLVMKLLFINLKWIAAWLVKHQRSNLTTQQYRQNGHPSLSLVSPADQLPPPEKVADSRATTPPHFNRSTNMNTRPTPRNQSSSSSPKRKPASSSSAASGAGLIMPGRRSTA